MYQLFIWTHLCTYLCIWLQLMLLGQAGPRLTEVVLALDWCIHTLGEHLYSVCESPPLFLIWFLVCQDCSSSEVYMSTSWHSESGHKPKSLGGAIPIYSLLVCLYLKQALHYI